jgi:putative isomerase
MPPASVESYAVNRWVGGKLITFSGIDGPTDWTSGLTLRTLPPPGAQIDIKLPAHGRIVLADVDPDWAGIGADTFAVGVGGRVVRGVLADAHHLLVEGGVAAMELDPALRCERRGERVLIGVAARFDAAWLDADFDAAVASRSAWPAAHPAPAGLTDDERAAWRTAVHQMKTMVYAPEGRITCRYTTPDRWPHRGMWLWDSAFHAVGFRHLDPAMARDAIEAVLCGQREDGLIPIRCDPGPEWRCPEMTQPPTLAMAAALVDAADPDPAWLARIAPRIGASLRWNVAHRDTDGSGLLEWDIEPNPNCRSGESGMDNSSRFDAATQLDAVDFNAFQSRESEVLADFARRRGDAAEAAHWEGEHARLSALLREQLWNPETRFFHDLDPADGRLSPVMASSGFLPLICGAATRDQAAALAAHLEDAETFGTPLRVPSIARCQPEHYSKDMWRGPVWINFNWLIVQGLRRYGFDALADSLANETVAELVRWHGEYGTFFEFFDDRREVAPPKLLRKGKCAPEVSYYHQAFFDYGWSATLFVDLVAV